MLRSWFRGVEHNIMDMFWIEFVQFLCRRKACRIFWPWSRYDHFSYLELHLQQCCHLNSLHLCCFRTINYGCLHSFYVFQTVSSKQLMNRKKNLATNQMADADAPLANKLWGQRVSSYAHYPKKQYLSLMPNQCNLCFCIHSKYKKKILAKLIRRVKRVLRFSWKCSQFTKWV